VANTLGFRALSGCSKGYSKVPGGCNDCTRLKLRSVILDYYPLSPITYRARVCCNFLVSHDTDPECEEFILLLFHRFSLSLSLSLSPSFLSSIIVPFLSPINSIVASMNNRVDVCKSDKSRRELFAMRLYVPAHFRPFFPHLFVCFARVLPERSIVARPNGLVNFDIIRLTSALFIRIVAYGIMQRAVRE